MANATVSRKRACARQAKTAALAVVSAVNVLAWLRVNHAHQTSSVAQIFAEMMVPAQGNRERLKLLHKGVYA